MSKLTFQLIDLKGTFKDAIGGVGAGISSEKRAIVGTVFTAKPFAEDGTFYGFYGRSLPKKVAEPYAWKLTKFDGQYDDSLGNTTLAHVTAGRGINNKGDHVGYFRKIPMESSVMYGPAPSIGSFVVAAHPFPGPGLTISQWSATQHIA